jgi:hypothetical protein
MMHLMLFRYLVVGRNGGNRPIKVSHSRRGIRNLPDDGWGEIDGTAQSVEDSEYNPEKYRGVARPDLEPLTALFP